MDYGFDLMVALGGTNIEDRLNPAIDGYKNGKTPVVVFVGRSQGKDAKNIFVKNGVPPYSEKAGEGAIILKDDTSATTLQNAVMVRRLIKQYNLGKKLYVSTESHHLERALNTFERIMPYPYYDITGDEDVVSGFESGTELRGRKAFEVASNVFHSVMYKGLPEKCVTDEEVYRVYSRDWALTPFLDTNRYYYSRIMEIIGAKAELKANKPMPQYGKDYAGKHIKNL